MAGVIADRIARSDNPRSQPVDLNKPTEPEAKLGSQAREDLLHATNLQDSHAKDPEDKDRHMARRTRSASKKPCIEHSGAVQDISKVAHGRISKPRTSKRQMQDATASKPQSETSKETPDKQVQSLEDIPASEGPGQESNGVDQGNLLQPTVYYTCECREYPSDKRKPRRAFPLWLLYLAIEEDDGPQDPLNVTLADLNPAMPQILAMEQLYGVMRVYHHDQYACLKLTYLEEPPEVLEHFQMLMSHDEPEYRKKHPSHVDNDPSVLHQGPFYGKLCSCGAYNANLRKHGLRVKEMAMHGLLQS
jgi:hypothetical protein